MNKIKNLVVSASAGTGKTYRLSLEYIAALSKKANAEAIDYKNILVMTFTRKATAEIKEGILKKLSEFIEIYDICKYSKLSVRETILNHENLDEKKKANYINLIESIEKIEKDLIVDREFLDNLSNVYKEMLIDFNRNLLKILNAGYLPCGWKYSFAQEDQSYNPLTYIEESLEENLNGFEKSFNYSAGSLYPHE